MSTMETQKPISDDRKLILELLDDLKHSADILEDISCDMQNTNPGIALSPMHGAKRHSPRKALSIMSTLMKTRVTEIEASLSLIPAPAKLRDMIRKQEEPK